MNKAITSRELVYFTGTSEKKRDFSGTESAFCESERLKFLNVYQEKARNWYDDPELNQKAITKEEVDAFIQSMGTKTTTRVRKSLCFDQMNVLEVYKEPEYEGLHLYCGAKVLGNKLVFPEKEIRPTPCALYEVAGGVTRVSFDVFIPADYKSTQNEKCGEAQPGRVIELRVNTLDKVKIKLCNSGEIFAMSRDMWRPEYTLLGFVHFGEWNSFDIEIGETITITTNGVTFENICPTTDGDINGIFFDGGLFSRSEWSVANLFINGKVVVFAKNESFRENGDMYDISKFNDGEEKNFIPKEVDLPYAIGGYTKRDHRVYLFKNFYIDDFEDAYINIETLDPCGKAWVNGHLILETDTFTENRLCVTNYLKKGENELVIMVEPRAPEVYYFWHRHNDCYNGWFCGEVFLELTGRSYITDMQVRTTAVSPCVQGIAELILNCEYQGRVKVYAQKIYPEESREFLLGENSIEGDRVPVKFAEELDIWSPESPSLYAIRAVLSDENGKEVDDYVTETGFRIICQRDGEVYLNDKRINLYGALLMQFLPPFEDVPVNHNCPSTQQIAWQVMMLKAMNGNLLRIHILGYGTNDRRYCRICDRLGIMLIWTTRFIDTLEELSWADGRWHEKEVFKEQIRAVSNYPSVIIYEGSNEYHAKDLDVIDRMYNEFIDGVKKVDDSRLLSPCSHLYYGGGIYDMGCCYYSEEGNFNQDGERVLSGHGWKDDAVIRSSHTYSLLCGYGSSWEVMRKQNWKWQQELLDSRKHSYLITEFAVTSLPNPTTVEALANPYVESYERPDEVGAIGRLFEEKEWRESQALQALCAFQAVKHMRSMGVDGMVWCCLMSGANNGSYMKPPIDFYGYKKLAFYALRDAYRPVYACKADIDVSYGNQDMISPLIFGEKGALYDLTILVINEREEVIDKAEYPMVKLSNAEKLALRPFKPRWQESGYYTLEFALSKRG